MIKFNKQIKNLITTKVLNESLIKKFSKMNKLNNSRNKNFIYSYKFYTFFYCNKSIKLKFYQIQKFNFSKFEALTNQDIKKKLKDKWEKKHGLTGGMPNIFSNKNLNTVINDLFFKFINTRHLIKMNLNNLER